MKLNILVFLVTSLIANLLGRRAVIWPWVAAALATIGAGIVLFEKPPIGADWRGVWLIQLSNICFAAGQIAYRRWKIQNPDTKETHAFAFLFFFYFIR